MGQELRVDEDRLRAVAREYDTIAHSVQAAYDELRAVMAEEGNFWGDDQTGRAFAETYVPDSRSLVESTKDMLTLLAGQGKALEGVLADLQATDSFGRAGIRDSLDSEQTQAVPEPASAGQVGDPSRSTAARPDGVSASDADSDQRTRTTLPDRLGAEPTNGASGAAPDTPGSESSDAATPPVNGSRPTSVVPPSNSKGSPVRGTSENKSPKATEKAAGAQRSDTPWARGARGSGSPASPAPGTVSAPSTRPGDGRGPRPNSPGTKAPHGPNIRKPATPAAARREEKPDKRRLAAPDEARRLAELLEDRHGLRVLGFDTPGIELDTLREIVRALDDVLTAHPYLVLPEFAIGDCGVRITSLDRSAVRSEREAVPGVVRMTLNAAAAKDVGLLARQTGVDFENRPLYFTIARELGHVLDITGGLRAHSISQRRLIAEYLSERGDSRFGIPVGAIVGDYRRWRGRLGEYGLPGGRFDPGMALADAFAEVQMGTEEAGAPAQVLQRLLVETAQRYSPKVVTRRPE
ncbi:hypothetical protein AB0L57_16615 [Nocardia sp. NPDC052254]|uniref:WXG100 family type VII secretion target n=1 Tax=Nocardia sp. NPDC052254 TaxID=3155681 RepID=UPI00342D30E0